MRLFLPNSLTWSTAGSRYPGGETLPGHYYGDPLTQLAPGHCWPSPCQRQLDPCPYPSPTPALLPSKHPKAPTPVHPVSVRRALQPPGTLPSPGIASFPACPGRGARFPAAPLISAGCRGSAIPALPGCGGRLPAFPASAASEPGIPPLFLRLAGSPGEGEPSAGQGGAGPPGSHIWQERDQRFVPVFPVQHRGWECLHWWGLLGRVRSVLSPIPELPSFPQCQHICFCPKCLPGNGSGLFLCPS